MAAVCVGIAAFDSALLIFFCLVSTEGRDTHNIYVVANIRGGGEFGPAWHQSALKANRNKAYEDFIAVSLHYMFAEFVLLVVRMY